MTKYLQIDPRISPKARGFLKNDLPKKQVFLKMGKSTQLIMFRENGYICYAFLWFVSSPTLVEADFESIGQGGRGFRPQP